MDNKARILVGVSGGIAAYKSCELVRALQRRNYDVTVVMTEAACEFVSPLTFEALSGHIVGISLFDDPTGAIPHITLAHQCDLFIIAPATANVIARLATGMADELLCATALALPEGIPLLVAPSMNSAMFAHKATQANLELLRKRGVEIIDPAYGYLACGDSGEGRMPEPEVLADVVESVLRKSSLARDMTGRHLVITAGPTREPIDAVRYISNYSSGKMGYSLAQAALERGAAVTLITGPVAIEPPAKASVVSVQTAQEMLEAAVKAFDNADGAICTAAVADFRPKIAAGRKLKKGVDDASLTTLELTENPDILKTLVENKKPGQVVIGFAAETDSLISSAQRKLVEKGADCIVANEVGAGRGFGTDDDEATLVLPDEITPLPFMPKSKLAHRICDVLIKLWEV